MCLVNQRVDMQRNVCTVLIDTHYLVFVRVTYIGGKPSGVDAGIFREN